MSLYRLSKYYSNSYNLIFILELVGNAAGQITDAVLDRASEMLGLKETLTKLYDKEVWKFQNCCQTLILHIFNTNQISTERN